MKSWELYLFVLIFMTLGYLAYGWKGVFWMTVIIVPPLIWLFAALTHFSNSIWGRVAKDFPEDFKKLEEEYKNKIKDKHGRS